VGLERITPIFQCMLERTDVITNEVLEPVTFVLAYALYWQKVHFALVYLTALIQAKVVSFPLTIRTSRTVGRMIQSGRPSCTVDGDL
jgi:hypothetical protein